MDREEIATDLLMRAENKGFRFHYDSGLLLVTLPATGDHDAQADIVSELGRMLPHVRRLIEHRAVFERSQDLLGNRVWSDVGMGTLSSAHQNGQLIVSVSGPHTRSTNLIAKFDGLFVLLEKPEKAAIPPEQAIEPKRKRLFGLLP